MTMLKDADLPEAMREDYTPLADIYHRSRPGYPGAMMDLLSARIGLQAGDPVVEIGAGTGHFTRLLAERGFHVTALEPVLAMQQHAPQLANVTWTQGTFEATGLDAGTQRWAVAAQAFHWADAGRALPEIRRVLAAGGWFTILWNAHHVARSPLLQWTYGVLRREVPGYGYVDRTTLFRRLFSRLVGTSPYGMQRTLGMALAALGKAGTLSKGILLQSTGDFVRCYYDEVLHSIPVDRQGYMDLWRSRNRLQSIAGDVAFERFLAQLAQHLAERSIDRVEVPYVCGAWSARIAEGRVARGPQAQGPQIP
jgi:SAM-dependent methyltransferase